jgi:hypothetical protein
MILSYLPCLLVLPCAWLTWRWRMAALRRVGASADAASRLTFNVALATAWLLIAAFMWHWFRESPADDGRTLDYWRVLVVGGPMGLFAAAFFWWWDARLNDRGERGLAFSQLGACFFAVALFAADEANRHLDPAAPTIADLHAMAPAKRWGDGWEVEVTDPVSGRNARITLASEHAAEVRAGDILRARVYPGLFGAEWIGGEARLVKADGATVP